MIAKIMNNFHYLPIFLVTLLKLCFFTSLGLPQQLYVTYAVDIVLCLKTSMRTPVRISGAAGAVCRPISSGLSRRSPVVAGRPAPCASAHLSRRE